MKLEDKINKKSKYDLDYDKVSERIDFQQYTKKRNINFKKVLLAVSSIVIIFVVGKLLINPTEELPPTIHVPPSDIGGSDYYLSTEDASIIGIAAHYEFDHNKQTKMSNIIIDIDNFSETTKISKKDENGEYLKASYPYDYVKIFNAYKFSVNVDDITDSVAKEIVENACGLGKLEVVVAEFETYIDDYGNMQSCVQDTLIAVRGYNGYYTILTNSKTRKDNGFLYVFSSHKRISNEEVSKDFTPPILLIVVEEDGKDVYVYFESTEESLKPQNYRQEVAFKNITEVERVASNNLYSVLELVKLPVKQVTVTITEINTETKCLTVISSCNLSLVYINDDTSGLTIEQLNIGDLINVSYYFYFDGYDPCKVSANNIELFNEVME